MHIRHESRVDPYPAVKNRELTPDAPDAGPGRASFVRTDRFAARLIGRLARRASGHLGGDERRAALGAAGGLDRAPQGSSLMLGPAPRASQ
jgi:hypothetical protein